MPGPEATGRGERPGGATPGSPARGLPCPLDPAPVLVLIPAFSPGLITLSHCSSCPYGHPEKIFQAPRKKDASARALMGPCPASMGSGYSITPGRQGRARPTLNRRSPRMLSRPAAAIIFLPAFLNVGSVAQKKNTAFAGDPLRRLRWPKWLPALL